MTVKWRAYAAIAVIGCALVATLTACGSSSSGSAASSSQTLNIGIPEEPDTLDPQTTNAAISTTILEYAGDTLVALDPSDNSKIVPDLATSWQTSSDGLTWTFTLKSGVKFQNGDPCNAAAVVASFERAMNPSTKIGTVAAVVKPVKAISAVGNNKVVITLSGPYSLFLQNLANPSASILDAKVAASEGSSFGRHPVLTGAWSITKWVSGDQITLTRNSSYNWGPAYAGGKPAKLKTLNFEIIPDSATQVAAEQSGQTQMTYGVPTQNIKSFKADPSTYTSYPYLRSGVGLFLEFNVTKPPFNDPVVREALNYAVNKKTLVSTALLNQGEAACGPLPPSIPGYWSGMCGYAPKYDPAKAKALLEQDGWTLGSDGVLQKGGKPFQFTLYSSATPSTWDTSSQLLQQQLKAVGIDMTIENMEFGTLLSKTEAGADSAHLMGYTYTTADILNLWFRSTNSGSGLDLSHVDDPKLDKLIDAYQTQATSSARDAALETVQKYISDLDLWVPLWVPDDDIVTTSQLKGAVLSKQGYLVLNKASLS
jgi:peptide/nickel transport system substrate-binding protein